MSVTICNKCNEPCSLRDVDPPLRDDYGTLQAPSFCVSACCRSDYTWQLSKRYPWQLMERTDPADPWGDEPF